MRKAVSFVETPFQARVRARFGATQDVIFPLTSLRDVEITGPVSNQIFGLSEPLEALTVFLHQAALGVIGAGVRSIPIGHTHGQQVLARLHDELRELADAVQGRDLATAGATCPAYEILCDEQSQLYTRIFRS